MPRGRNGPGGPAGLQNRVGDACGGSGGFDSHTLPPPLRRRRTPLGSWVAALALLLAPLLLSAQQAYRPGSPGAPDSVRKPPVGPTGAMLRSLLIPGLGQYTLGRKLTGTAFLAFEGVSIAMVVRAQHQLNEARAAAPPDSALIASKGRQREDWLVLLGINHALSALEAYVSANLWDFPGTLRIGRVPGGMGAAASLPFRLP